MPVSISSRLTMCRPGINAAQNARPFAVFTLDDGYRDNRDYAYAGSAASQGAVHDLRGEPTFADGNGVPVVADARTDALRRQRDDAGSINGQRRTFDLRAARH